MVQLIELTIGAPFKESVDVVWFVMQGDLNWPPSRMGLAKYPTTLATIG